MTMVRRQKKAVTLAAKSRPRARGESPVPLGNRRNLAEERIVRKISSPGSITGMPYLCYDYEYWPGPAGWEHVGRRGSIVPVWASESDSSLSGSPVWLETHCKLSASWEERESEKVQLSQKDLVWRNAGAVDRRARADWKSVRKRADWKWHFLRLECHHSKPCTSARHSAETFLRQRLAALSWWCSPRSTAEVGPKWQGTFPRGPRPSGHLQSSGIR